MKQQKISIVSLSLLTTVVFTDCIFPYRLRFVSNHKTHSRSAGFSVPYCRDCCRTGWAIRPRAFDHAVGTGSSIPANYRRHKETCPLYADIGTDYFVPCGNCPCRRSSCLIPSRACGKKLKDTCFLLVIIFSGKCLRNLYSSSSSDQT